MPIVCLSGQETDFGQVQKALFDLNIATLYAAEGSYTAIPEGGILRIAIFASHTKAQLDRLLAELNKLL